MVSIQVLYYLVSKFLFVLLEYNNQLFHFNKSNFSLSYLFDKVYTIYPLYLYILHHIFHNMYQFVTLLFKFLKFLKKSWNASNLVFFFIRYIPYLHMGYGSNYPKTKDRHLNIT